MNWNDSQEIIAEASRCPGTRVAEVCILRLLQEAVRLLTIIVVGQGPYERGEG